MILKEKSLLSKTYRWFYDKSEMPKDFCLYSKKLLLMFILIIPSAILSLPYNILQYFTKENYDSNNNNPGPGVVIWFGLFLLQSIIIAIINIFISYTESSYLWEMSTLGWFLIFFTTIAGSVYSIIHLKNNFLKKPKHKTHKPNIIREYIKAKKNKYCPKITWK